MCVCVHYNFVLLLLLQVGSGLSIARLGTQCSGYVMKAASLAAVLSWHLTLTAISMATVLTAMEQLPPTDTQSLSPSSSKKYIISVILILENFRYNSWREFRNTNT